MRVWLALALLAVVLAVSVEAKKKGPKGPKSHGPPAKGHPGKGHYPPGKGGNQDDDEDDGGKFSFSFDFSDCKGGKIRCRRAKGLAKLKCRARRLFCRRPLVVLAGLHDIKKCNEGISKLCKPRTGKQGKKHCDLAEGAIGAAEQKVVWRMAKAEKLEKKAEEICDKLEEFRNNSAAGDIEQLEQDVVDANESLANIISFWEAELLTLKAAADNEDLVFFQNKLLANNQSYTWQMIPGREECIAEAAGDQTAIDACWAFYYYETEQYLRVDQFYPDEIIELVLANRFTYFAAIEMSETEIQTARTLVTDAETALENAQNASADPCGLERRLERRCKRVTRRYNRLVRRNQHYERLIQVVTECYKKSCPNHNQDV